MPSRPRTTLDCTRCGACCTNPVENRREDFVDYVEVRTRDALLARPDLARRLVVYNDDGLAHLKLDPAGRCLALRGRVGRRALCTIYEHRPAACRKVEQGSERCLAHRLEHGLVNPKSASV
jgi:Fe-S-cluster containining protein